MLRKSYCNLLIKIYPLSQFFISIPIRKSLNSNYTLNESFSILKSKKLMSTTNKNSSFKKSQQKSRQQNHNKKNILLFYPNLIGYTRICILAIAIKTAYIHPELSYWLFLTNFILDFFDGYIARKFNQVSKFGAFFDVIIDNVSRGVLWAWSIPGPYSAFPIILEMLAFTCLHKDSGSKWKTKYFEKAPFWIKVVLKNGFKSPAGIISIAGLMGCPLWLWAKVFLPNTIYSNDMMGFGLILARCFTASIEIWVIYFHIFKLLNNDSLM